ncbi:MAG TPA: HepT-like ribonuclease domain-containing protein [Thermoanaerobaculia bacterium]|nr:HepT-like ribonuclease domain-containing protein [Thermoanaerobaculia bacterium]
MPPDRDPVHLWDMLQAARGVIASVEGLTFDQYAADENLRLAVERRIEILGEAARRVSTRFKEQHPEIPWRPIVDQRNVLIHAYDEVADERIWKLAVDDIPQLIGQLAALVPPLPPLR